MKEFSEDNMADEATIELDETSGLKEPSYVPKGYKIKDFPTALFKDKKEFLNNPTIVKVKTLGKDAFNNDLLYFYLDGIERSVKINKYNIKELAALLGSEVDTWNDKVVTITGSWFEGNNKVSAGVMLKITK